MIRSKTLGLATVYLLLTSAIMCFAAGKVDRSKAPAPGPAPTIQMGDYASFELENGLKVFVVENRKLPTITISLLMDWDPIFEGDHAGYVQMVGDMLRRGTTNRTKDEIDAAVDFIGAQLFTTPSTLAGRSLKKHGETLFEIIADLAQNASFPEEELEKVRTQALSNLQSAMDDPDQIMENVRGAVLYGADHPYGEVLTEASLKSIQADKLKAFYRENFKPNLGYLALVGDITAQEARSWVEAHFGSWKKGPAPTRTFPAPKTVENRQVAIVNKPGAVQTVLNVANTLDMKPNSPDAIKARVTNILLGGTSFRLFNNLREDKAYTYGAYSRLSSDPLVGEFRAYGQVRNEVTKEATKEFLFELNRIRDELAPVDELEIAKNYASGEFARRLEDPNTIAQYAINTARYNLGENYYQNYLKEVARVTPADVQAIAQKYIHPDKATIFAVGNSEELAKSLAEYGDITFYDALGKKIDAAAMALPEGLTAEKVLAAYVEAIGGEAALAKVQDLKVNGTMGVMGMSMAFNRQFKAPNKISTSGTIEGQTIFSQVFNGESGTTVQAGQKMPIEGDTLAALKLESTFIPERFYARFGVEPKLTGAEKLNDKLAYRIESQLPGNVHSIAYFDAETGLKVKTIRTVKGSDGATTVQTVEFKDYREVNGIKFPFVSNMSAGPQKMEITTNTIEMNQGIPDAEFEAK